MAGSYIPMDIILNILVRLPASSLQRLKCVSKEWFRFISDPDFAEAHLTHQSQEKFGSSVIMGFKKCIIFIGGTSSSNPNPPRHVNLPGAYGDTWVHGSCNGLILFQCSSRGWKVVSLHVANPITGDNLSLPPFYEYSSSILSASIGCGRGRDIKVVVVTPLICGVLTLGSGSWREVHFPVRRNLLEPYQVPIPAGGTLNWIYDTGVLSLDLCEEMFHQTNVSFCSYTQLKYHSDYLEWDGGYAVIFVRPQLINPFYRVWILKESKWTKLPDIDVAFFERLGHPCGDDYSHHLSRPICATTMRNGEIILFWQEIKNMLHLFAYDSGLGVITNFTQFDKNFFLASEDQGRCTIMAHVNSLVSCSTAASLKRNGWPNFQLLGLLLTLAFNFLARILANFQCTLRSLFRY